MHDRDTGLIRFGARDYDPATGKWTAKDPIDFSSGDLSLLNYCYGDPINYFDVTGLSGEDRVEWVLGQYNDPKLRRSWGPGYFGFGPQRCNEFVYGAHVLGDPQGSAFPTVLKDNNGYPIPNVEDLADPCFRPDVLKTIPMSEVQPGDILVWYGSGRHHSAIYIGDGNVVYAGPTQLKMNSISATTKALGNVPPIVRRFEP